MELLLQPRYRHGRYTVILAACVGEGGELGAAGC